MKELSQSPGAKRARRHRIRQTRWLVLVRDDFRCVYCGHEDRTGYTLQVDHIIPLHKKGPDTFGNVITACRDCNQAKRHRRLFWLDADKFHRMASRRNQDMGMSDDYPYQRGGANFFDLDQLEFLEAAKPFDYDPGEYDFLI